MKAFMHTQSVTIDGQPREAKCAVLIAENDEELTACRNVVENPGIISELASLDFEAMAQVLNDDDSNDAIRDQLIGVIEAAGYEQQEVEEDGDTYDAWVKTPKP